MGLNTLICLVFLFFASVANAVVNLTGISGAVSVPVTTLGQTNVTTIDVYGGTAGDLIDGCVDGTRGTATCNNCTSGTLPCNSARVHPEALLAITFTTASVGQLIVQTADVSGQNPRNIAFTGIGAGQLLNSGGSGTTENSFTFYIAWSELCLNVGGNSETSANIVPQGTTRSATCPSTTGGYNAKGRLIFGIDGNGSGGIGDNTLSSGGGDDIQSKYAIIIHYRGYMSGATNDLCQGSVDKDGACNFVVYPGDKKVFIDDVKAQSTFAATDFRGVRIYYDNADDGSATLGPNSTYVDLAMTTGSSVTNNVIPLQNNIIDGLENGVNYDFAIASLDVANNVDWYKSSPNINYCYDATSSTCHSAQPDEVIGLLENEFDCFIATAAYGSALEPHVALLRKFRNLYLHPTPWGRAIIKWYYRFSPRWAHFIKSHPALRFMARLLLAPFWLIAAASIYYPMAFMTFLFGLLVMLLWYRTMGRRA